MSVPERVRDEFGECDSDGCDSVAYYLIRDRKDANEIRLCGSHLGGVKGAKGADE